jgi:hypothetical protein
MRGKLVFERKIMPRAKLKAHHAQRELTALYNNTGRKGTHALIAAARYVMASVKRNT